MENDDVVAELERWRSTPRIAENAHEFVPMDELLQRARDEIMTLRAQQEAVRGIAGNERRLSEAIIRQARDEALDEAARVCEGGYTTGSTASTLEAVAKAIRALKDKA